MEKEGKGKARQMGDEAPCCLPPSGMTTSRLERTVLIIIKKFVKGKSRKRWIHEKKTLRRLPLPTYCVYREDLLALWFSRGPSRAAIAHVIIISEMNN
jgi:hypothetical protein